MGIRLPLIADMRPTCKYPRKPTGPSGFGEAGVRDLQRTGGYQRTRPSTDVLAVQSGNFSKVIVSGVDYLITGDDEKYIRRDTKSHLMPFIPSIASAGGTNLGQGVYARGVSGFSEGTAQIIDQTYTYTIAPGQTSSASFLFFLYPQRIYFGGYYNRGALALSADAFFGFVLPTGTYFYRSNDTIEAYGHRPGKGAAGVSVGFQYAGRIDPAGRPLHEAYIARFAQNADTEAYAIIAANFTRPMAEFYPLNALVVTKSHTCVLLAEVFFRPELVDPGEDYRPKFWLVTTPNTEAFGTLSYSDLTNSVFSGARIPTPSSGPDGEFFSAIAGRQYSQDLSVTLGTVKTAVVGDNAFVMSWQQRMPNGWRQRVARVTLSGGTATAVLTYESGDDTQPNTPFWQCLTHLGDGVVLAKVTSGWVGTGFAVAFRRSVDGGQTWSAPFTTSGLDAPMQNQYLGNFTAHRPYKDGKHGVVLMPAWNQTEQSYYVYESKDSGDSWKKRGRIYKPTTFRRVDTMIFGDGGGNFDDLLPGPSPSRPIDVTLPNRFKERP